MYAEVAWVLVSLSTQVQPQVILDPDYIPDYLSVSYDYDLNDSQIFKSSSCKRLFLQSECYRCNLLRWMFFVPCDNWKLLFFLKVCRYCDIFSTVILSFYFETSVLKEVPILRYLDNQCSANTNANAKFQNKVIVYYTYTELKSFPSWPFLW